MRADSNSLFLQHRRLDIFNYSRVKVKQAKVS